jgi:hypothetical protein
MAVFEERGTEKPANTPGLISCQTSARKTHRQAQKRLTQIHVNNPFDLLRLVENRGHLGRYGVRGSLAPWEQGPAGSEPLPGASGVCQSFSNLCPSHPAIDFQGAAVIP